MARTPIRLTLYDEQGEVTQEFTCAMVPWKILKRAVALTKIDMDSISEDDVDAIAQLVVDAFHGQFTIQDLDEGADIGELMTVLQSIVGRASGMVTSNPTMPPRPSKKRSR